VGALTVVTDLQEKVQKLEASVKELELRITSIAELFELFVDTICEDEKKNG